MPAPQSLPESVRALTRFHAFELRDVQWTEDAKRFGAFLETYGATSSPDDAPLTMSLDTLRQRMRDGPSDARNALIREYLGEKLAFWLLIPFVIALLVAMVPMTLGQFDVEPFNTDDPIMWLQELAVGFAVGLSVVSYWAWSRRSGRRRSAVKQEG